MLFQSLHILTICFSFVVVWSWPKREFFLIWLFRHIELRGHIRSAKPTLLFFFLFSSLLQGLLPRSKADSLPYLRANTYKLFFFFLYILSVFLFLTIHCFAFLFLICVCIYGCVVAVHKSNAKSCLFSTINRLLEKLWYRTFECFFLCMCVFFFFALFSSCCLLEPPLEIGCCAMTARSSFSLVLFLFVFLLSMEGLPCCCCYYGGGGRHGCFVFPVITCGHAVYDGEEVCTALLRILCKTGVLRRVYGLPI